MADRTPLTDEQIQDALDDLPGWSLDDGKLHKEFDFGDFVDAFGFMSSVALVAESMNHHPSWHNVYASVTVDLWTHDAEGITELDVELAHRMEDLAS